MESRTAAPVRPLGGKVELCPLLENGDCLSAEEFLRRFERMPDLKKAELVDGIVYMASPVSIDHGESDGIIQSWLGLYAAYAQGVKLLPNTTLIFDNQSVVQPDAMLVKGDVTVTKDGYVTSVPGFVVEIALTSASIDLNRKLETYRTHKVPEYLVWRPRDQVLDWFVLDEEGNYQSTEPAADGLLRSEVFPGLILDPQALLRLDSRAVLESLSISKKQKN